VFIGTGQLDGLAIAAFIVGGLAIYGLVAAIRDVARLMRRRRNDKQ
jgi:hypothetical protein